MASLSSQGRRDRPTIRDLRVTHLKLENWRNFRSVDVELSNRMFLAGPNASGKSNLLDVFRFLRDIAKPGGGFQKAVSDRGGVSKVRCLAARQRPLVTIHLTVGSPASEPWTYEISFKQDNNSNPILVSESVRQGASCILKRPDKADDHDPLRMSQTALEQVNANAEFRTLVQFFAGVSYLHILPQLIRDPSTYLPRADAEDPFGRSFMDRLASSSERSRASRLLKIEEALKLAVPQLGELRLSHDHLGVPHLSALYKHWRPNAGKQYEDQFSDGTLRLVGLLWSLLEGEGLLLLEEPEISLHGAIVKHLAPLISRMQRSRRRQIIVSTHSGDLLSDPGIGGEEVLLLLPAAEGTNVRRARDIPEIRGLLDAGVSVAEAVLPLTEPESVFQFSMFKA